MKNTILTLCIVMLTTLSAVADSSILPENDIQILRDEIHRQELILTILKEKLSALEKESVSDRIKIEIGETGYRFDGEAVSVKEVEDRISTMSTDGSVTIVADAAVPLEMVTSVLDSLKHHGISDVSIAASKSEQGGAGQPDNHPEKF